MCRYNKMYSLTLMIQEKIKIYLAMQNSNNIAFL